MFKSKAVMMTQYENNMTIQKDWQTYLCNRVAALQQSMFKSKALMMTQYENNTTILQTDRHKDRPT